MRAVACLGVVALCLGLTGCSLFGKKSSASGGSAFNRPPAGSEPLGPADRGLAETPGGPPGGVGGLLAGQVVDSFNRQPPRTFIQVVSNQDPQLPQGARIEVATDPQGFFTIQGLQPGRSYQLIARAQEGGRLLAGATWVTPPNPKVLIRVSEDGAARTAAPVPALGKGGVSAETPAVARDHPATPGLAPRAAELAPPTPSGDGAAAPVNLPPQAGVRPQDIADTRDLARRENPTVNIPPQAPRTTIGPPAAPPATLPPTTGPVPGAPLQVPSCVLTGRQLDTFAVHDLNGQPWEFRANRRGRLVLLDFWGTWCLACVQGISHLNGFQRQYGPHGLQVIGIACEQEGPLHKRISQVKNVVGSKQVGYTVLLGGDSERCPVKTQFGVTRWPTLVLLDETGRIIWRGEGLTGPNMHDLDTLIRQQLGLR